MGSLPVKVARRLVGGLKRYQPILRTVQARDVNESDTVLITSDVLADLFGYDKYTEITSEFAIRGTYCDLAVVIDGSPRLLVEVKAAGHNLKDSHVKQATDYAANQGIEWVALTNGSVWQIYRIIFSKPIDHELVIEFDLLALSHRSSADLETLFILTREGLLKSVLSDYYSQQKVMNRFSIGAILLTEPILKAVRRELRHLSSDIKFDIDDIESLLSKEILKRDIVEGEKADEARKMVRRALVKRRKSRRTKTKQPVTSIQDISSEEVI